MVIESKPRKYYTFSRLGKIFGVQDKHEEHVNIELNKNYSPKPTNNNHHQHHREHNQNQVISNNASRKWTPSNSNSNASFVSAPLAPSNYETRRHDDNEYEFTQLQRNPTPSPPPHLPSKPRLQEINQPSHNNRPLSSSRATSIRRGATINGSTTRSKSPLSNKTTLNSNNYTYTNNTITTTSNINNTNNIQSVNNVNNTNGTARVNRSQSTNSKYITQLQTQPNSALSLTNPKRFVVYEDGTHEHHLKNAKRQEKLSHMLKNLLGGQKLRDEAKSAVPDLLTNNPHPPTLVSGLINQISQNKDENYVFNGSNIALNNNSSMANSASSATSATTSVPNQTFVEKYGRCQEVIGKGTFGVVRIAHKKDNRVNEEKLFAVKEFKRKPTESDLKYSARLQSEYYISSSLKHPNIIETLDLLKDAKGDFVQVMEYCSGGDLYTLIITATKLDAREADCFFKQLIRGVVYMHEMGIAHRDLKPENLLLTESGVLKITDFGNGECFKIAWEDKVRLTRGICGSSPYIAPEEYNSEEFDPRSVDIWACGVIYMAMRTGRHLWGTATNEDEFYQKYLEGRKSVDGYEPIEKLKREICKNVVYSILDPVPERRLNGHTILNSQWVRKIKCCVKNTGPNTAKILSN